jgi:hypothetical protein
VCYKENFVQAVLDYRNPEEFGKAYYKTIMEKGA